MDYALPAALAQGGNCLPRPEVQSSNGYNSSLKGSVRQTLPGAGRERPRPAAPEGCARSCLAATFRPRLHGRRRREAQSLASGVVPELLIRDMISLRRSGAKTSVISPRPRLAVQILPPAGMKHRGMRVRYEHTSDTFCCTLAYTANDGLRPHRPRTQPVAPLDIREWQHADVRPHCR